MGRVLEHLRRVAVLDQVSLVQEHGPVGDPARLGQVMGHDHDGQRGYQAPEQRLDRLRRGRGPAMTTKVRSSASEFRCAEDPGAGVADEGGGEAEVESGGPVELRDGLVGKLQIGGTEVVEQLIGAARADDGVNGG
jgi:hypothetical protein